MSESDSLRCGLSDDSWFNDLMGEDGLDASPEKILRDGYYYPEAEVTPRAVRRVRTRFAEKAREAAKKFRSLYDDVADGGTRVEATPQPGPSTLSGFDARHVINRKKNKPGEACVPPVPRRLDLSDISDTSLATDNAMSEDEPRPLLDLTPPPVPRMGDVLVSDDESEESDHHYMTLDEIGHGDIDLDDQSPPTGSKRRPESPPTPSPSPPLETGPRVKRRLISRREVPVDEPGVTLPFQPDPPIYLGGASGRGRPQADPPMGRFNETQIPQGLEGMPAGSHLVNQWKMVSYGVNVIYDPDQFIQRIIVTRDADGTKKVLRPLAATETTLLELIEQGFDGLNELD